MTERVRTVPEDASFKAIVRSLEEHRVDALPVVDDAGLLVGIVSSSDLTCHEEPPPRVLDWLRPSGREHVRKAHGRRARDLMSSPVRSIGPDATVGAALREMARHHVGRLVVLDGPVIAGMLTRSDLLRVFLREDDEICAEVRSAVDAAVAGGDSRLDVQVTDGVVRLDGWVERTSAAWAAAAAARAVPGVVELVEDVQSDVDDTEVHLLSTQGPFA